MRSFGSLNTCTWLWPGCRLGKGIATAAHLELVTFVVSLAAEHNIGHELLR